MQTANTQYSYFRELERSTKAGLNAYLFILVAGSIIASAGVDKVTDFFSSIQLCEGMLICVLTVNMLMLFTYGINRIHWLGELHIWFDRKFFKFLFRSNEIILRELMTLLDPKEREIVDKLRGSERNAIARSIFSELAEDQTIFESLLKRGIFKSWIWYWIMIYGVLVFVILSIIAFSKLYLEPTIYSNAFFTAIGVVGLLHFILSIFLGYNLIWVTRRVIQEITYLYHNEIISLLHNYVNKA